jgi:hypothetical protein
MQVLIFVSSYIDTYLAEILEALRHREKIQRALA